MVEEVDVDADADVGLHAFGCVAVARLDAEAPAAGLGGGQGSLAHDECAGIDFDAVELGTVPAHPGRVSRVAVDLLGDGKHHRLRGVDKMVGGGRDIGVVSALYIERRYFLFVTYLIISRYRKTQT